MKNMNFPQASKLHGRTGWQAAQKDRLAGCTTGWASEVGCTLRWAGKLHIKLGCGKGWA